jgi:hypothetical protein
LIEDGLNRYAMGDLDGALLVWDEVLALDPENSQASSYIDYVRTNYELLTGIDDAGDGAPFAIGSDEPEYQIEILPGEIDTSPQPRATDRLDEGWFIDDEARGFAQPRAITPPQITFEIEADEPPNFEDATREYLGQRRSAEPPYAVKFEPQVTPGFDGPDAHTPTGGFGAQVTDIGVTSAPSRAAISTSDPTVVAAARAQISLRTPVTQDRPKYVGEHPIGRRRQTRIELSYSGPSDEAPTGLRPRPAAEDLISGLPAQATGK